MDDAVDNYKKIKQLSNTLTILLEKFPIVRFRPSLRLIAEVVQLGICVIKL